MPLGTIVHDVLDRQINTLLLRLRGLAKIACFYLVEELVPFLDLVPSPSRPRLEGKSSLAVVSSNFGGAEYSNGIQSVPGRGEGGDDVT